MRGLLVIARDDARDDGIAADASRIGYGILRPALLGTEPGKDNAKLLSWLKRAPSGAAVAWTSRRAARALVDLLPPDSRESLSRVPLFAVGPESAAPLRERGFRVEAAEENPSAAALARLILDRRADLGLERVAFLHGNRALPDLPESLRSGGLEVDPFELYRTRFLSPDLSELEAALAGERDVWVFYFSPSGVEALERLVSPLLLDPLRRRARAVGLGETTRAALEKRGYARLEPGMAGLSA